MACRPSWPVAKGVTMNPENPGDPSDSAADLTDEE